MALGLALCIGTRILPCKTPGWNGDGRDGVTPESVGGRAQPVGVELWFAKTKKKNQFTLIANATTPRIKPASARPPPPNVPPLDATRWRDMKPMIAATGPRTTPRQMKKQAIPTMPQISDAIANPSVRGPAYAIAPGTYPIGAGGT